MESKLLYEMYNLSIIERTEIISYLKIKEPYLQSIDYYDVIYSDTDDNIFFLKKLNKICYDVLFEGELQKKYSVIITLFHRCQHLLNIKKVLYHFFYDKRKKLLEIDFDFWNLIETDYELEEDGFEGITDSIKDIEKYLKQKSFEFNIDMIELISLLGKI